VKLRLLPLIVLSLLPACSRGGSIEDGGVFITRSGCPLVGIPAATGDVTLFDPPASRDARAIDVVAYLTNVRSQCGDSGDTIVTTATYTVNARRRDGGR